MVTQSELFDLHNIINQLKEENHSLKEKLAEKATRIIDLESKLAFTQRELEDAMYNGNEYDDY